MNTLTNAKPAQPASATHGASAPAAATDPGNAGDSDLDFSALLGAGIGRTAGPATAREPAEKNPVDDKKDVADGTPVCDPAALLDAIAAGKATLDLPQLAAAEIAAQITTQINVAPMPASPVQGNPATLAQANDSTALPVIARGRAPSALRTGDGKEMAQDDQKSTATAPRTSATGTREEASAAPAVTVMRAPAHESAAFAAAKTELPERGQDRPTVLAAVVVLPAAAALPVQSPNAASVLAHVEHLAQPFSSPAWDDGFSSRVVWMARNDVQSAEIRLNPPDLGPIEVKLVMTGDQGAQAASIQFSAAHAATREAIESALPRLREMLQQNGIALGNTTVDARTAGNTGSDDSGRASHGSAHTDARAGETPAPLVELRFSSLRRGNGLVDTFA